MRMVTSSHQRIELRNSMRGGLSTHGASHFNSFNHEDPYSPMFTALPIMDIGFRLHSVFLADKNFFDSGLIAPTTPLSVACLF